MKAAFEKWAKPILGDNPTWAESGQCELVWQDWQAATEFQKLQDSRIAELEAVIAKKNRVIKVRAGEYDEAIRASESWK